MPITMMTEATDPAAVKINYAGQELFVKTEYVGEVVEVYERNGYDDSDFFAVAFHNGYPIKIMYATTRGWSYANHAEVDAPPELMEAYAAYRAQRAAERAAHIKGLADLVAKKGDEVLVRVLKGKNLIYDGHTGEVFWVGENKFKRYGHTVGVKMADGNKIFVDAERAFKVGDTENVEERISNLAVEKKIMGYVAY